MYVTVGVGDFNKTSSTWTATVSVGRGPEPPTKQFQIVVPRDRNGQLDPATIAWILEAAAGTLRSMSS